MSITPNIINIYEVGGARYGQLLNFRAMVLAQFPRQVAAQVVIALSNTFDQMNTRIHVVVERTHVRFDATLEEMEIDGVIVGCKVPLSLIDKLCLAV